MSKVERLANGKWKVTGTPQPAVGSGSNPSKAVEVEVDHVIMAVPANVAHRLLARNPATTSATWFRRALLERIDYDPVRTCTPCTYTHVHLSCVWHRLRSVDRHALAHAPHARGHVHPLMCVACAWHVCR